MGRKKIYESHAARVNASISATKDRINFQVHKNSDLCKPVLQAAADKVSGGSLNGFITDCIARRLTDILTPEEIAAARADVQTDKLDSNDK